MPEPRVGEGKGVKRSTRGNRGFQCREWGLEEGMRSRERWIWGRFEACWICRVVVCVWDVC